ncbi:hypothetical protein GCM10019016_058720 [Streptomyces prasinosporus]|uniref:Uncharacterized protein n=1 Tax=Streptomyces prasinosporus TaxID=68256 RepID=A0ABP6TW84_9ACTN
MDVFASVSSGLSHDLVAEITVHSKDHSELVAVAFDRLTSGVTRASVRGELDGLARDLPVSDIGFSHVRQSLPKSGEREVRGFLSVSPQGTFDVLYNPYVPEVHAWLRSRLEEAPESATVETGEFTAAGEVGNSVIRHSVSFDEDLPDYVMLTYHVDEAVSTGPATTRTEHERLLGTLRWACDQYNVVFGHVSYSNSGGGTEHERFLRGWARVPSRNTPLWRERLRGYSWLTVRGSSASRHRRPDSLPHTW